LEQLTVAYDGEVSVIPAERILPEASDAMNTLQAVILAGGLGTRLSPLTLESAKGDG